MARFTDTICVADLEVRYRVGVSEEERRTPQRLTLTIEMQRDTRPAAAEDDLALTVDYEALCRGLLAWGQDRQWRLIETLANDIAQWVLTTFAAQAVSVEVKKFVIPQARHVSVRVSRTRSTSDDLG